MPRYEVAPVHTQWGIWDSFAETWAGFFGCTPEDLTYELKEDAEAQTHRMNTEIGLN